MSEELKPCPFCGAGITFAKEFEDGTATDCSKEESIEKWNRRANDGKTD